MKTCSGRPNGCASVPRLAGGAHRYSRYLTGFPEWSTQETFSDGLEIEPV